MPGFEVDYLAARLDGGGNIWSQMGQQCTTDGLNSNWSKDSKDLIFAMLGNLKRLNNVGAL